MSKKPSLRNSEESVKLITELREFTSQIQLGEIFLQRLEVVCMVPPSEITPTKTFMELNPSVVTTKGDGWFIVESTLELVGFPYDGTKKGEKEIFRHKASFNLIYFCHMKTYSEEVLRVFAERNGTYNAWPFHRELITSNMARMRISPFYLDLINPYQKVRKKQKA